MGSVYTKYLKTGESITDESYTVGSWEPAVSYATGRSALSDSFMSVPALRPDFSEGESMAQPTRQFPPMPEIGHPESHYARLVHAADRCGDIHAHEAAKVGQYITLGLDPSLTWESKLKYFRHALKRHCVPPPYPDDEVWLFYQQLADQVRQFSGQEALRIASREDDLYAARLGMGQTRERIEDDAEQFFGRLLGTLSDQCPEWFNETDWSQLKLIRDQWI